MKRKISIILCTLLCSAMVSACGAKPAEENSQEAETVTESVVETEMETVTEKVTETQTEDNSETQETLEEETYETEESVAARTSQSDAISISLGTKTTGTLMGYEEVWYAFTTGENQNISYNISFLITTMNGDLRGELYDESGIELEDEYAYSDGAAYTISTDQLEANTTYYVRLVSDDSATMGYALVVRDSNATGSILNQKSTETENNLQDGKFIPGSNQYDAALIPLGTKVFGTLNKKQNNAWYAFTTGENLPNMYTITFVNETTNSNDILGVLFDEYGKEINLVGAEDNGRAVTISADQLNINTTYYIGITPDFGIYARHAFESTFDYSVIVKDFYSEETAYKTAGSLSEAQGNSPTGEIFAGTNQNEATLIPLGTKVSGTIGENDSVAWFAFTTGENRGATYTFTCETSLSEKSYSIYNYIIIYPIDEYGTRVETDKIDENTRSTNQLEPNTTYYILFENQKDEQFDYSLMIEAPEEKFPLEFEETLVFEVPFEINETQIQFVINKADFIDEAKAKEKLKPVAEAILEYPDHSILIAGTTATDGTQESCVDLSNRRAEAVKNLLVNTYGVPESQLQIIGLGYERDPFVRGKDRDSNGKFVESEGRKNRRVVILDVESPIAQEILNGQ